MTVDRQKLATLIAKRYADALDRGMDPDQAVTVATNIPGVGNISNLATHMRNNLTAGMLRRKAIASALESALGPDPADMPTERQYLTSKLAARFEAEMDLHGDPERAARTAVAAIPGRYNGVAAHLAAAAGEGLEGRAAAVAAVDRYFGGGGKGYGHTLIERTDIRPAPTRRASRKTWDDLKGPEKSIVASYLVSTGRGGEEPTSADIDDAFAALSNQR